MIIRFITYFPLYLQMYQTETLDLRRELKEECKETAKLKDNYKSAVNEISNLKHRLIKIENGECVKLSWNSQLEIRFCEWLGLE